MKRITHLYILSTGTVYGLSGVTPGRKIHVLAEDYCVLVYSGGQPSVLSDGWVERSGGFDKGTLVAL